MKRSEINKIILNGKRFIENEMKFLLPPFAAWTPASWEKRDVDFKDIIEQQLGWDITDFGSGDFYSRGLFLFTIRNGKYKADNKPYAEKIMIVEENQETPLHFHWSKMEDIINRGGGNLVLELYNSTSDDKPDSSNVIFKKDGVKYTVSAGGKVVLTPGESICLEQGIYHRFYGEPGKGKVLVGEVSMVNDDNSDNCFYEALGRFPEIEEDELPSHLLVSDYKKLR